MAEAEMLGIVEGREGRIWIREEGNWGKG